MSRNTNVEKATGKKRVSDDYAFKKEIQQTMVGSEVLTGSHAISLLTRWMYSVSSINTVMFANDTNAHLSLGMIFDGVSAFCVRVEWSIRHSGVTTNIDTIVRHVKNRFEKRSNILSAKRIDVINQNDMTLPTAFNTHTNASILSWAKLKLNRTKRNSTAFTCKQTLFSWSVISFSSFLRLVLQLPITKSSNHL